MSALGSSQGDTPSEMNNLLRDLHASRRQRAMTSDREFCFGAAHVMITQKLTSTGGRVWDGSVCLCEYLATLDENTFLDDLPVLELGAGTGLTGCVVRTLFPNAGTIVLADRASQKELIEENLKRNELFDKNIEFRECDWCV